MMYMLTPMESHPDNGFGVVADAFYNVGKNIDFDKRSLQHLPVEYLLRHSIELYLKSIIVLLTLTINKSVNKDEIIETFSHEHNLRTLFISLNKIIVEQKEIFQKKISFIGEYPENFERDLFYISDFDSKSTFYRYPISGDKERDKSKDHSKKTTIEKINKNMKNQKTLTSIIYNDKDEIISINSAGINCDSTVIQKMNEICEYFSTLHIAIRMEMFGGF